MCTVLNNRLSCVAEDEGLIAEEQAGFRKTQRVQGPGASASVIESDGSGRKGRRDDGGFY